MEKLLRSFSLSNKDFIFKTSTAVTTAVCVTQLNRNEDITDCTHIAEIHEHRHVASLPASSILQKYNTIYTITSKQLLINYTSNPGSLNFGMTIVDYFLVFSM